MKKVIFCLLLFVTSVISCEDIGRAENDQFMYEDWLKIVEISEQANARSYLIGQANRALTDCLEIADDLRDLQEFYGDEFKKSSEFKDLFCAFVKCYFEVQRLEEEAYNLPEKQQIKDVLLKYTHLLV